MTNQHTGLAQNCIRQSCLVGVGLIFFWVIGAANAQKTQFQTQAQFQRQSYPLMSEPANQPSSQALGLPDSTIPGSVSTPEERAVSPQAIAPRIAGRISPTGRKGNLKFDNVFEPPTKTKNTHNDAVKSNAKQPQTYDLNFDIYRDRNPYPIDPRKPCTTCVRPPETYPGPRDVPGYLGRPHKDHEPGGCTCGKPGCRKPHPMFSVHWPRPFSARMNERWPNAAVCRSIANPILQLNSRFDHLENFNLFDYQRRDSGYCGEDSDPYGCLGESRHSRVAGLLFRQPGQPLSQGR